MAEEKSPRYDYIHDDAHNTKALKRTKKHYRKADHKHDYIDVLLDIGFNGQREAKVCSICGRLRDWRLFPPKEPRPELPVIFVGTGREDWISFLIHTKFVSIPRPHTIEVSDDKKAMKQR